MGLNVYLRVDVVKKLLYPTPPSRMAVMAVATEKRVIVREGPALVLECGPMHIEVYYLCRQFFAIDDRSRVGR